MSQPDVILIGDAPFPRMLQIMLDPMAWPDRYAALNEFFAHDLPDFAGWCGRPLQAAGYLLPAHWTHSRASTRLAMLKT